MPSGAGSDGDGTGTVPEEAIADGTDEFLAEVGDVLGADRTCPDFAAEIPISHVMPTCGFGKDDRSDCVVLYHQIPSPRHAANPAVARVLNP